MQIEPAELLATKADDELNVVLLDVRSEADFGLSHLWSARPLPLDPVKGVVNGAPLGAASQHNQDPESKDGSAATRAWNTSEAESVVNACILKGGMSNWIRVLGGGRRTQRLWRPPYLSIR